MYYDYIREFVSSVIHFFTHTLEISFQPTQNNSFRFRSVYKITKSKLFKMHPRSANVDV